MCVCACVCVCVCVRSSWEILYGDRLQQNRLPLGNAQPHPRIYFWAAISSLGLWWCLFFHKCCLPSGVRLCVSFCHICAAKFRISASNVWPWGLVRLQIELSTCVNMSPIWLFHGIRKVIKHMLVKFVGLLCQIVFSVTLSRLSTNLRDDAAE